MDKEFSYGQYVVFNNELHVYLGANPTMNGCYKLESENSGEIVAAHNLCVVEWISPAGLACFSIRHKE